MIQFFKGWLLLFIIGSVYVLDRSTAFGWVPDSSRLCRQVHAVAHQYHPQSQLLIHEIQKSVKSGPNRALQLRWNKIQQEALDFFTIWNSERKSDRDFIKELNEMRLIPSNTGKQFPKAVAKRWQQAHALIFSWAKDHSLGLNDLIQVNQLISEPTRDLSKGPGVLRHRDHLDDFVYQGQFGYKAVDVRVALEDLLAWYHREKFQLHPIVLATEFTHRFLTIHPFHNGNGRTARLIMDWILVTRGYPPPSFIHTNANFMLTQGPRGEFQGVSFKEALAKTTLAIESTLELVNSRSN